MTTSKLTKTLLSTLLLGAATGASAAAFQLAEVSTSGLGRAYAGEAVMADNASVVATNPALMNLFKQNAFSAGGVYVDSRIHMRGPVRANVLGVEVAQGSANHKSVVPGSFIPNMYFVSPVNDKFAIGAGMNVNFGLKSEYEDGYDAGLFGGKTDLTAINLNLSGAYRMTENWSAGLGLNAIYAKAKVERTAGILDTAIDNVRTSPALQRQLAARAAAAGLPPTGLMARLGGLGAQINKDTLLTHLQDKAAWAFGWNAGLLYQFDEKNRIGLAYHAKVDIDFKDNNAISYAPRGTSAYVGEGELTLHLPSYWELSGFHQLTNKLALHYSYKYTQWHRLKDLHATYNNGQVAFHKDEGYRNNSRFALGTTYDLTEQLTLRAGVAYDKSAAGEHHSASIPDTDRTWYSVGATYKFTPNFDVDFGYAYLHGKKLNFKETQSLANGLVVVEADYHSKASANLYGLNLNYRF